MSVILNRRREGFPGPLKCAKVAMNSNVNFPSGLQAVNHAQRRCIAPVVHLGSTLSSSNGKSCTYKAAWDRGKPKPHPEMVSSGLRHGAIIGTTKFPCQCFIAMLGDQSESSLRLHAILISIHSFIPILPSSHRGIAIRIIC